MPRIFISYRRSDTEAYAGRIYDSLVSAFGSDAIFKDVYDIRPGRDFRGELRSAVAQHDVILVLIGPGWLTVTNDDGQRRLDDPGDWVRLEVETGLQRQEAQVIPLLVGGARMPRADDLPQTLRELAFRNATTIRNDPDYHRDMAQLIEYLRSLDAPAKPVEPPEEASLRAEGQVDRVQHPAPPPQHGSRSISAGRVGGVTLVLLTVLLAFLALFSEEWRNDAFYKLGLYTATPDLTGTADHQTLQTETVRTTMAAAQIVDSTSTAVMQRTVDAQGTESALLLTTNTQIAAQTQTAVVPTLTPTTPPQDALEVQIEPLAVEPGQQVAVRTEPGATCLFTPSVGRIFGFDQTSGLILFQANYDPGVTVSVTCRLGNRTSEPLTFRMVSAEATDTPIPPTPVPSPVVIDTPVSASGDTITLTIFRDEDSFTLYVPQTGQAVSLVGFEYRVTLTDGSTTSLRLDRDFASFLGMPFANVSSLGAVCFRIVRSGGTRPVPQACQSAALLLPQEIASADMFWRDRSTGLFRTILVYRDDQLIGVCGPQDSCPLNWPVTQQANVVVTVASATGYPCAGTIIFRSGAMNQVKVSPLKDAPNKTPVQQGLSVQILESLNNDGIIWYQIEYDGNTGWIATDLVEPSALCPK
ncbi:MAG: TIR domain-containing protein [Anaerolineae bacterium]|nr:TIR domain-containing protein [Anaerolineae bacterium]